MENETSLLPAQKYMLTIKEAAIYFNIGVKNLRRLAENNEGQFAILMLGKYLIIRDKFEQYLLELASKGCDMNEKEQLRK